MKDLQAKNWNTPGFAKQKAVAVEMLRTTEERAAIFRRRVEARRMIEDEREIASINRTDALDQEIAAFERGKNI